MNIIENVNPNPGKEDSDFTYSATIDLEAISSLIMTRAVNPISTG
jgi:hypothetical protein